MEWNTVADKLILEWLSNRTPPLCICVNILSMAHTINPNAKVVKEIPCAKYIQNMHTVLSLVTKWLAGKMIGSSTKIKQLHTNGTSHKGTEVVNLICSILSHDNKLRTMCLASNIISEDGTAECQSTAIVNQFSETGRLLEGWRNETKAMYKKRSRVFLLCSMKYLRRRACVCLAPLVPFFWQTIAQQHA